MSGQASTIQVLGAGGFGALIGWYVYYINRYRRADVQLSDIVTLVGAIGGVPCWPCSRQNRSFLEPMELACSLDSSATS
jgi:hypothetical protein